MFSQVFVCPWAGGGVGISDPRSFRGGQFSIPGPFQGVGTQGVGMSRGVGILGGGRVGIQRRVSFIPTPWVYLLHPRYLPPDI